jgi:hypothetical protein
VRTLYQVLLDYDFPLLRAIAWYWDHDLVAARPREAAEELSAAMLERAAVARAWDELSETARAALGALQAAGGRMPSDLFFRRFGALAPVGPGRLEREERWRAPANVAERLWYRGLIARAFDTTTSGHEEFVFIPSDLRAQLPAVAEPAADPPGGIAATPAHARRARSTLVDDLTTLLADLQRRPVAAGAGAAQLQERLQGELLDPDPDRLAFAWRLALACGLVAAREEPGGAARLRPDGAQARPWMEAGRAEQLRALADAWRDDGGWDDLRQVPELACEETGWRNEPLAARRAVLGHLAAVPAATWWSLPEFVAALKSRDPDFARSEYESWYIRTRGPDGQPGDYLRGFASWDQVEGALIAFILRGPLHWLGLVDLAQDAFRLNARGVAFVRGAAAPAESEAPAAPAPAAPAPAAAPAAGPPAAGPAAAGAISAGAVSAGALSAPGVRVAPDATIEVPRAVSRYVRFQVARVADWLAAGETYRYRLSPASLERARAQGISAARLDDFLRRHNSGPVPIPVRDALRRWDEQGGEVALHQAVVLRVASPALLDQLLQNPRAARCVLERLGPAAALVRRGDAERLAGLIRELGYLVERDDAPRGSS